MLGLMKTLPSVSLRFFLVCAMMAAFAPPVWSQIEIPLEVHYDDEGYQYVGVHLSLGNSGTYNLYLLDTGSQPLMVSQGIALGGAVSQNTSGTISYGATSSDAFSFDTYQGSVHFKDVNNATHSATVQFGVLTSSGGLPGGAPGGILGAGPAADNYTNTNPETSGSTPTFNLFSIIGQMEVDPSLRKGFTIRVDGANSLLTIGISHEYWNTVPLQLPMQTASSPHYPHTNAPTYDQDQIASTVTFEGSGGSPAYVASPARSIKIDSGAPTAFFIPDNEEELNTLQSDGFLTPDGDKWSVSAGTLLSVDAILGYEYFADSGPTSTETEVYNPGSSGTYSHFNTGINPFNQYEITFLLDNGHGEGFVGFNPIPEPGTWTLLLLGGAFALWRRHHGRKVAPFAS